MVIVLAALVIRSMLGGKSGYELEFSTKNIVVGETATATLKGVDSNAAEPEVLWTSSENNVVSVEGEGLECTLTAKSLGSATIIATVEGEKVASGTVTVVAHRPWGCLHPGEPGRGDHFLRGDLHHQRHCGDGEGGYDPCHHQVEQQQHLRG